MRAGGGLRGRGRGGAEHLHGDGCGRCTSAGCDSKDSCGESGNAHCGHRLLRAAGSGRNRGAAGCEFRGRKFAQTANSRIGAVDRVGGGNARKGRPDPVPPRAGTGGGYFRNLGSACGAGSRRGGQSHPTHAEDSRRLQFALCGGSRGACRSRQSFAKFSGWPIPAFGRSC